METEIRAALAAWGVELAPSQEAALEKYRAELLAANAVMNLISPKDEAAVWSRHFADSLAATPLLRRLLPPGGLAADSGTGAGFPGIPLAAAFPGHRFELLDSQNKRCEFIRRAAAAAGIANIEVFHRRVGEGPKAPRYALVCERAMGKLENILPQCLNMLSPGGHFLAWQSAAQMAESRPAVEQALRKCRARLAEKYAYRLPGEQASRYIAVFRRG
jgi:16S rRNA (guanine527-N7)-methyltransferase